MKFVGRNLEHCWGRWASRARAPIFLYAIFTGCLFSSCANSPEDPASYPNPTEKDADPDIDVVGDGVGNRLPCYYGDAIQGSASDANSCEEIDTSSTGYDPGGNVPDPCGSPSANCQRAGGNRNM